MSEHALLSPSGAEAWMACPGKLTMEKGLPDDPNDYSDEGTAAHTVAASCLKDGIAAIEWRGRRVDLGHRTFEVTKEMCADVQIYVDQIRSREEGFRLAGAVNVDLLIEARVDFSPFVGRPESFGTADVIMLIEWPDGKHQIDVNDLKFGRGVQVFAQHNPQMMTYALGAYDQYEALGDVTTVSMAIHQPRLYHYDDWELTVDELLDFGERLGEAADVALAMYDGEMPLVLTPGEAQCRFCKAKAICPALREQAIQAAFEDFKDIPGPEEIPASLQVTDTERLDALFPTLELVDIWVRSVRSEIERRALNGVVFRNCKVVQGKRGPRAWGDPAQAEAAMKSMRIRQEEMYETKIISPTAAEKVLKDSPKRWARLQQLITQSPGPLSIAPITDKRPAVVIPQVTHAFDEIEA
jgi:hypothetical protein